ncbi:ABC transporter substrate-binding protein [Paenarthrobacter sp. NPDC089316]|uniref:ABC transporter substrate-binding protein n=1 Tax=unclassified Paenarthrobacter TaxID=2634190 RepID=UPI0034326F25
MKTNRLLPVALIFVLGLVACSSTSNTGGHLNGAESTTVKVAAAPGGIMPVSFRAAVEAGIFRKYGLDVRVQDVATGLDAISAAVQGGVDIAYSDLFGGAAAPSNGFDVGLVTPLNGTAGGNSYLLVKDDSPLQSVADLKGATVAVGAPPLFKTLAWLILDNAGVDVKSIKWVIVPEQTTFASRLATGQVDAAYTGSAISAEKWLADGDVRSLDDPKRLAESIARTESAAAGFWATGAWYDENSEIAEKFTQATTETNTWFLDLPLGEQAAHVKKQTGADPVVLDKAYPGLLQKMTVESFSSSTAPVDEAKLAAWFSVGRKYAAVPEISFDELLLPSSRAK